VRNKSEEGETLRNRPSRLPVSRSNHSVIALLTDFGTADYYVGSLKGVILSINPNISIVDISHEVPAQDIEAGAFTLLAVHSAFPPKTIFVAVVDPGVGSSRRPILVQADDRFFVGPDNGLFSYFYTKGNHKTIHLTTEKYFRHPVSSTFHGRDVFAPAAAHLSTGLKPNELGSEINDELRLPDLQPVKLKDGVWAARIIHIDHFGNCITNISRNTLSRDIEDHIRLKVSGKTVTSFRKFFSDSGKDEKLFAIWGSAGFLEIAAQNRSAAKMLKAKRGDAVLMQFGMR
jgi:S-adenosyl-L-methionine hydrolase (adenosine-forming)